MANLYAPTWLGFFPQGPSNTNGGVVANTADTWLALSFFALDAATLSKVQLPLANLTGTGTAKLYACLYSDSSALPGTLLQTSTRLDLSSPNTGPLTAEWVGFNYSLSDNTRYWIVFKNASDVPGTVYPTFRFGGNTTGGFSNSYAIHWNKVHCTDGSTGPTWGTAASSPIGMRIETYDNGESSYLGLPVLSVAVGNGIYGTREHGVKITIPTSMRLRVRGVALYNGLIGTANYSVAKLYDSSDSLVATSNQFAAAHTTSTNYRPYYFSSSQILEPGGTYSITYLVPNGDSSNYLRYYNYTCNSSLDLSLYPFNPRQRYYNGSTWAESTVIAAPFALILGDGGEFIAPEFPAEANVATGSGAYGWNNELTPSGSAGGIIIVEDD